MARPSKGWRLRPPRPGSGNYTVVFTWPPGSSKEIERSTGTADLQRAQEEAARIYAREVSRPARAVERTAGSARELEEALTRWLDSLSATLDASTVATYTGYGEKHFVPFFKGLHNCTSAQAAAYTRKRLGEVVASSVRKELSALRGFGAWASHPDQALIPPFEVPSIPKRTVGTPYSKRRRSAAIPISAKEAKAILAALPEWSTSKRVPPFPIRARFVVAYETGLRPELIDQLSVPEHYHAKSKHIVITAELDKGRWIRRVPLTAAARKALDRVLPERGVIFGHHDYREHLRAAAEAVFGAKSERAAKFTGAHLRSARATHWLDKGAPLTGVQFLLGHKRLETTARYVRAAEKAADQVVKLR